MKTAWVICRSCGHKEKIKLLEPDDDPRTPRQPLRCPKCGNPNVTLD